MVRSSGVVRAGRAAPVGRDDDRRRQCHERDGVRRVGRRGVRNVSAGCPSVALLNGAVTGSHVAGAVLVALLGESMYAWTADLDRLGVRVARRLGALAGDTGEGEDDGRGKDAEDDDDDEQFDKGEPRLDQLLAPTTRLDVVVDA